MEGIGKAGDTFFARILNLLIKRFSNPITSLLNLEILIIISILIYYLNFKSQCKAKKFHKSSNSEPITLYQTKDHQALQEVQLVKQELKQVQI